LRAEPSPVRKSSLGGFHICALCTEVLTF